MKLSIYGLPFNALVGKTGITLLTLLRGMDALNGVHPPRLANLDCLFHQTFSFKLLSLPFEDRLPQFLENVKRIFHGRIHVHPRIDNVIENLFLGFAEQYGHDGGELESINGFV